MCQLFIYLCFSLVWQLLINCLAILVLSFLLLNSDFFFLFFSLFFSGLGFGHGVRLEEKDQGFSRISITFF